MKSKSMMLFTALVCILHSLIHFEKTKAQDTKGFHNPKNQYVVPAGAMTKMFSLSPQFTAPIRIKVNGIDMKVDTYTSVPCAVDWNQDGKKDLLVGSFYYGNVYFFNNSGTNIIPVFTSGVKLKTDGLDISVAYG